MNTGKDKSNAKISIILKINIHKWMKTYGNLKKIITNLDKPIQTRISIKNIILNFKWLSCYSIKL